MKSVVRTASASSSLYSAMRFLKLVATCWAALSFMQAGARPNLAMAPAAKAERARMELKVRILTDYWSCWLQILCKDTKIKAIRMVAVVQCAGITNGRPTDQGMQLVQTIERC